MTSHTLSFELDMQHRDVRSQHALRLAAIADNLNNVLTVISAHAALLQSMVAKGDPQQENIEGINDAVKCAGALAQRLILIADHAEP